MNFKYYKTGILIPFILVLSVVFNIVSNKFETIINTNNTARQIHSYVGVFSTLSLITITLTFINFVGWKWWIFKWLIDIPNLNGRYTGELVSSFIDPATGNPMVKDCAIEIKQSASSIHIFSYYGDKGTNIQTSRAYSVSEELVEEKNGLFQLFYIFTNDPETLLTQLNNHAGTAKFKHYPDIKTLDGDYYNQRKNIGTIKVAFQQKKRLGRLV
ncbi:MAG: hypothetical protein RIQ61_1601 [Bacteroidota bacterium]|jgi:hypothetical protein